LTATAHGDAGPLDLAKLTEIDHFNIEPLLSKLFL
jgi:hypothetical protein